MSSPNKSQLYSIQMMRGIAAVVVVFYHLSMFTKLILNRVFMNGVFNFGYSGVDIFFVLSGFIMYYVYNKYFYQPEHLGKYLKSRFLRIFPLFWVATAGVLAAYLLLPQLGRGFSTEISAIIRYFLLIPVPNSSPIIIVAWTLSHEIKFYILLSILFLIKPRQSKFIFSIFALVSIANLLVHQLLPNYQLNYYIDFATSYFNLEFFLGIVVGYYYSLKVTGKKFFNTISPFLLSAIYLDSAFVYENFFHIYGDQLRILFYGIPSLLIINSLTHMEAKNKIKTNKLLLLLGDASYSLYLVHYPLLAFFFRVILRVTTINSLNFYPISVGVLCLTVFSGIAFHKLVEIPLVTFFKRYSH